VRVEQPPAQPLAAQLPWGKPGSLRSLALVQRRRVDHFSRAHPGPFSLAPGQRTHKKRLSCVSAWHHACALDRQDPSSSVKPRRGVGRRHEPAHRLADLAGVVTAPVRRGAVRAGGGPEATRHRPKPRGAPERRTNLLYEER